MPPRLVRLAFSSALELNLLMLNSVFISDVWLFDLQGNTNRSEWDAFGPLFGQLLTQRYLLDPRGRETNMEQLVSECYNITWSMNFLHETIILHVV